MGYSGSETNGTCRLSPEFDTRFRTELEWKEFCAVVQEVFEDPRDGKHASESRRLVLRPETTQCTQLLRDLRKWLFHLES